MKYLNRLLAAATASLFFASAAHAQNPGSVTNHAFMLGKGAGTTGYTSLLCTSAQLAVGQSAADPICRTLTGDVTLTAAGVTAIGATKVTSAMLNADVFSTAHTWAGQQSFVAPILGTPASGTLTNATGLPISTGVSGLGTGIATALAINTGSAGAPALFNGALGTPSSGTLTNATGLPISTGVSGLGTGCATFLATPSSANLRGCLTDEAGSGSAYFVGGSLGTPASGTATNLTGLPLSGLNTQAAWSFVVNNTSGTASPTAVDIASFTTKASPAAGDYIVLSDQAASGALKKATVSSVASAGSVSSINGQTGAIVSYFPPQGRLTLVTATPVMTTSQSAKTTIYYTPYVGNMVPIYDGTNMVPTAVAEISVATTDNTKNPAAIGASKVNDWFVWNDSGTIRLTHSVDWTNDTTRASGLTLVNGIYLNTSAITNGPGASRGTYVGTTRSNSSSQLDWIFGSTGTGSQAGTLYVWNAYNRVSVGSRVGDTTSSWTYNSTTWRQARGSAGNQIAVVVGLSEDALSARYETAFSASSGAFGLLGVGVNSTSSPSASAASGGPAGSPIPFGTTYLAVPSIGVQTFAALEATDGGTGGTFYGNTTTGSISGIQYYLSLQFRM